METFFHYLLKATRLLHNVCHEVGFCNSISWQTSRGIISLMVSNRCRLWTATTPEELQVSSCNVTLFIPKRVGRDTHDMIMPLYNEHLLFTLQVCSRLFSVFGPSATNSHVKNTAHISQHPHNNLSTKAYNTNSTAPLLCTTAHLTKTWFTLIALITLDTLALESERF